MSIATVITVGDRQTIELPPEIRLSTATVEIRQLGEALLVEPKHSDKWPEGFSMPSRSRTRLLNGRHRAKCRRR